MITKSIKTGRVGLMVVGHKEYWPQFKNSRPGQLGNAASFESLLRSQGIELVTYTGVQGDQMIDTPEESHKAGVYFKEKDLDLLFVFLPGYVASGRYMLGLIAVGCPIVLVGHQAQYEIATRTMNDSQAVGGSCCLPEAVHALNRCQKPPVGILFGRYYPDTRCFDERFNREISEWCRVADCLRALKGAIFGSLGHTYEGMLDMNYDPTTFTRTFGIHIRHLEMCQLVDYVDTATNQEVKNKIDEMHSIFDFLDVSYEPNTKPISQEDIEWSARCSVGLDKLVVQNNLSGLAYYYEGLNNHYERVASNLMVGNSMLTSRGISLAGESDMKTCIAMFLNSSLGCGGSFAEMGSIDFDTEQVLVGHDGPHDIRIADQRPTIRGLGLYHGKRGHGISVEFSLKAGPMTMMGTGCDADGRYSFIVAEGESCKGPVPKQGNTFTRAYFGGNIISFIEDWAKAGNCHHYSLSIGRSGSMIDKLGKVLDIPVVHVR